MQNALPLEPIHPPLRLNASSWLHTSNLANSIFVFKRWGMASSLLHATISPPTAPESFHRGPRTLARGVEESAWISVPVRPDIGRAC